MHWFHYLGKFLTRLLLLTLIDWQVAGRENVPKDGPLLVVANHLSMADPPIVSASLGRQAVFMAKQELFVSPLSRFFVKNFGAFPVRRGGFDRSALEQTKDWLKRGKAVVMFPEGMRSKTYRLQPGFPGSALIASNTGAAILPVGLTGTQNIGRPWWWLHRPNVTINIGKPFRLPAANGRPTREELAQLTDSIMGRIAELLPSEYGGKEKS